MIKIAINPVVAAFHAAVIYVATLNSQALTQMTGGHFSILIRTLIVAAGCLATSWSKVQAAESGAEVPSGVPGAEVPSGVPEKAPAPAS